MEMNPTTENGTRSLADSLRAVAREVGLSTRSTATSAALRRGEPTDVARTAAFYRVLLNAGVEEMSPDRLARWGAIVQCMAIAGDPTARLNDGGILARAGYTESRFSRLLSSREESLRDQCVLLARLLRARDHPAKWDDLGALIVLEDGSASAELARRRLARDFYFSAES